MTTKTKKAARRSRPMTIRNRRRGDMSPEASSYTVTLSFSTEPTDPLVRANFVKLLDELIEVYGRR